MKVRKEINRKNKRYRILLAVLGGLLVFMIAFFGALLLLIIRGNLEVADGQDGQSELVEYSPTEAETEEEATYPRPHYINREERGGFRRIWIGDSRMVGLMRSVSGVSPQDVFIAKGAMFFEWFRDTAVPSLIPYLDSGESINVIIEMGVNDAANNAKGWLAYGVSDYIALINGLINSYPNARFFFMSVGRTVGNYRGTRLIKPYEINPEINDFNARMQYDCHAIYLAAGEYIYRNSLSYADGVHYSTETNRILYDYVLSRLNLTDSEAFEPYPTDSAASEKRENAG